MLCRTNVAPWSSPCFRSFLCAGIGCYIAHPFVLPQYIGKRGEFSNKTKVRFFYFYFLFLQWFLSSKTLFICIAINCRLPDCFRLLVLVSTVKILEAGIIDKRIYLCMRGSRLVDSSTIDHLPLVCNLLPMPQCSQHQFKLLSYL